MDLLHRRIVCELGLHSLYNSPRDTKILILQRFIRFFAFGGSTIVLALYLHAIHMPDAQIGLFMSLTLVGDVISFGLALLADGVGRKIVLGGGALLMVMSGVVFAVTGNFWFLLVAGVFGVISPKYVHFRPIVGFVYTNGAAITAGEKLVLSAPLRNPRWRILPSQKSEVISLLGM